ncbi:MAG TPA: HEAT repeat domain-containing protein [Pyrinomonadaceae bacterium]|jgi:HEAT repeat protein|nr:HEAT repeat domain-containing protein [Pyrinomonadaceae bacterium]
MAVDPAEGDAAGRLSEMERKGIEEKRRPIVCPVLFFFLCLFAVNAFSQDLESLERDIRSGNSEEKRTALYEIKKIATEPASRIAIPAVADADPLVRATAAAAVVFLQPWDAGRLLAPLLKDKDELVRREAAYALGKIRDQWSEGQLINAFRTEKSTDVRAAILEALGERGSGLSYSLDILKTKPKEDEEFLRRTAARSIGQFARRLNINRTDVVTPENFLPEKFKDIDPKKYPGPAFRQLSDATAVLMTVLSNDKESDDTRREAAFALGEIGDLSAMPLLRKYLNSPDPYLAEICKEALLKLQPQK